jgi:2,6-dihydroxypseudooxynicotine hydrolase
MAFDGPGQGEMFFQVRFRPDFEQFTSAVVDYIQTRPEVDPQRIGVLGRSLGGYLAVRSAAFDHRFRACVAWGALNDLRHWDRIPELTRAGFTYIAGLEDQAQAREFYWNAVSLEGVAGKLACPLYVLHGARDTVLPGDHVERLRAAARRVPQTIVVEKEGNHCCHNLYPVVRPRMADWLAKMLAAA